MGIDSNSSYIFSKLIHQAENKESLWGFDKNVAVLNLVEGKKRHSESKTMITVGIGLQYIIYEELGIMNPRFIHYSEIEKYKFCLVSFTSHYDVLSFLNIADKIKRGKCKLIAGGAGLNNPELFSDIIDYQIVGRAENSIAPILRGEISKEVYTKDSREIKIVQPKKLLRVGKWNEISVGCSIGCKFCQYGWKFKNKRNQYISGMNSNEDFLTRFNFNREKHGGYGITALDGWTEKTRMEIGKKITDVNIVEKLKEVYISKYKKHQIKLYNVVGLPNEKPEDMENFLEILKEVDCESDKEVNIFILATHFVPMRFTPMENEKVNEINFREYIYKKYYLKNFYNGKTFKVSFLPWITDPRTASISHACESVRNRMELIERIKGINRKYSLIK